MLPVRPLQFVSAHNRRIHTPNLQKLVETTLRNSEVAMMLEQSLITHSAPTLAGLKTGSLFCFSYSSGAELEAQLSRCRLALQKTLEI